MAEIKRFGDSRRWSDVVIHRGTAYWVEVADDLCQDTRGQVDQVLKQIDATLGTLGSERSNLIMITIHLADLGDATILNELWDVWVPERHPPVRACVQSGLSGQCRVEIIITAAVE